MTIKRFNSFTEDYATIKRFNLIGNSKPKTAAEFKMTINDMETQNLFYDEDKEINVHYGEGFFSRVYVDRNNKKYVLKFNLYEDGSPDWILYSLKNQRTNPFVPKVYEYQTLTDEKGETKYYYAVIEFLQFFNDMDINSPIIKFLEKKMSAVKEAVIKEYTYKRKNGQVFYILEEYYSSKNIFDNNSPLFDNPRNFSTPLQKIVNADDNNASLKEYLSLIKEDADDLAAFLIKILEKAENDLANENGTTIFNGSDEELINETFLMNHTIKVRVINTVLSLFNKMRILYIPYAFDENGKLLEALSYIKGKKSDFNIDLHWGNIGFRENGQMVIVDPFAFNKNKGQDDVFRQDAISAELSKFDPWEDEEAALSNVTK